MASQPTLRPSPPPVDRWAHPLVDPRQADRDALHFPKETYPLLTDFREKVINYIYLTARDYSEGTLTSASVAMSDEDDGPVLDLTLVVDGDWAFVQALQQKDLAQPMGTGMGGPGEGRLQPTYLFWSNPESTEAMYAGVDTRVDGQGRANRPGQVPIDGDEGGMK